MPVPIHPDNLVVARVSIINPKHFTNPNRITEIVANMKQKVEEVYIYDCPDGLIIFDRYIEPLKTKIFYQEIMNYRSGINDFLSLKDKIIRKEEVDMKWLDGNFCFWLLENS